MRKPNSENLQSKRHQSGNAMIYVLIGIALIGFLTVTMSRQTEQADSQDIDDEIAELYALQLIEYANAAKGVIDQMEMTGTSFNQFVLANPSSTPYNTPPHIHKIYHPQGGGLTYIPEGQEELPFVDAGNAFEGWHFTNAINVEWTPSTQNDLLLSAYSVDPTVCAKINEKITGSGTVPQMTSGDLSDFMRNSGTNTDLTAALCPGCEGYPMLCVQTFGGSGMGMYSILLAR